MLSEERVRDMLKVGKLVSEWPFNPELKMVLKSHITFLEMILEEDKDEKENDMEFDLTMQSFKLGDLNCYQIALLEDEDGASDTFPIWAETYETDSVDHMFHIGDACVAQIPQNIVKNITEA